MIYVHRYMIGTNDNKKERVRLWLTEAEAVAQQAVLGGYVQAFVAVEEIGKRAKIAASEISEKFDYIASRQLHLEAPLMWHKSDLIHKVCKVIRGEFDAETGLWK